jgi:hypothetical protein
LQQRFDRLTKLLELTPPFAQLRGKGGEAFELVRFGYG